VPRWFGERGLPSSSPGSTAPIHAVERFPACDVAGCKQARVYGTGRAEFDVAVLAVAPDVIARLFELLRRREAA
jgi:hypothetical protein